MFRVLAELLTYSAIPIWFLAMGEMFVRRAWDFLPSFLLSAVLVAPVLGIAILCELRDASQTERPPRHFFPSQRGFISFIYAGFLITIFCGYVVGFGMVALRLPGGDTPASAWARLLFCLAAILVAWLLHYVTTVISHHLFARHIYEDWLDALGKPITLNQVRREFVHEIPATYLVVFAVLGTALCWFGIEWADSFLDVEIDRGSRMRKLQAKIRWLARHPNTVQLFSASIACSAGTLLGLRFVSRRNFRSGESQT